MLPFLATPANVRRIDMKRLISRVVRIAVLASLVLPASAAAQQSKVEQELLQIERDWCTADLKVDKAMMGRILADDASLIGRNGQLETKAQAIAAMDQGVTTTCELDMMKVRVYGDAAVVTGRSTVKGKLFNGQSMWTDTFIRKDGRWQCVASQSSEIKK